MKLSKLLIPLGLALWAIFVFAASNGPDDVEARANAWLSSPVLKTFPVALLEFASTWYVIAASFLAIGLWIGWKAHVRYLRTKAPHWSESLATSMYLMADRIEGFRWTSDLQKLNADLMILSMNATKHGLAFPKVEDGFTTINHFLPYLHRVGTLLRAHEIAAARDAASHFAASPKHGQIELERGL